MSVHADWDAKAAVARRPIVSWRSEGWRAHSPAYAATDATGARRKSGRYHRASDRFPDEQTWPVLYLALSRDIWLGELIRNATALPLKRYRITRLRLALQAVLDCRDVPAMGLSLNDLIGSAAYDVPQRLAAAAVALGVEGMLVPSATLLGDNLILFVDQLRPGAVVEALDWVEPNLSKQVFP